MSRLYVESLINMIEDEIDKLESDGVHAGYRHGKLSELVDYNRKIQSGFSGEPFSYAPKERYKELTYERNLEEVWERCQIDTILKYSGYKVATVEHDEFVAELTTQITKVLEANQGNCIKKHSIILAIKEWEETKQIKELKGLQNTELPF